MRRRIGSIVAALVLGLGMAGPAAAEQPAPIEDRLITELEGFELRPEGEFARNLSGPINGAEVLAGFGVDAAGERIEAYGRVLSTDAHSGSLVVVMGVDMSGRDADEVLAGLATREGWSEGPTQVFVDADPPLDGLVSYAVWGRGARGQVEVAAYVAGDLLVVIEVHSSVDRTAYLRRAAKAQVGAAPATATPGYHSTPAPAVDPTDDQVVVDLGPDTAAPSGQPDDGSDGDEDVGGTVAAAAPAPRSGFFDADGGNRELPLVAGAAAAVVLVGWVVRTAGGRKRVRPLAEHTAVAGEGEHVPQP